MGLALWSRDDAGPAVPAWDPSRAGPLPAPLRGGVVMLGNFDGFHRGHKALAATAGRLAAPGRPVILMCCDPHPRAFFAREALDFLISPGPPPGPLLRGAGVDLVYAPRFDAAFAGQSPEQFVAGGLARDLGVRAVVTGADFRFGRARVGRVDDLRRLGARFGIAVHVQPEVTEDGSARISSTGVRAALRRGDFGQAARLLGHDWIVPVRRAPDGWRFLPGMVLPPDGDYAVHCHDAGGAPLGMGRLRLRGGTLAMARVPAATAALRWSDHFRYPPP